MKFRVYSVTPTEFDQWTAHQKQSAVFPVPAPVVPVASAVQTASVIPTPQPVAVPAAVPIWTFPADRLEKEFASTKPTVPIPVGMTFDESLLSKGDAARGQEIYSRSSCIGCHAISGNKISMGIIGPNLTHVATRHTLAAGLYPMDAKHLAYWIKNAPHMKPGSIMPTIGKGLVDPVRKMTVTVGGLTDPEIADIVAYLLALKLSTSRTD